MFTSWSSLSFVFPVDQPDLRCCLLASFSWPDENGKDQGINVRQKVKEMVEFVQDDDKLREERKKAKKNKDKYIGVSSDGMGAFKQSNCKWRGMNDVPIYSKMVFTNTLYCTPESSVLLRASALKYRDFSSISIPDKIRRIWISKRSLL